MLQALKNESTTRMEAIKNWSALLKKRDFLMIFIRTLEEQKRFTVQEKYETSAFNVNTCVKISTRTEKCCEKDCSTRRPQPVIRSLPANNKTLFFSLFSVCCWLLLVYTRNHVTAVPFIQRMHTCIDSYTEDCFCIIYKLFKLHINAIDCWESKPSH